MKHFMFTVACVSLILAFVAVRPAYAATRYIDSMFDNVKTTKDVSYGTYNALTLDIYEPEGDTETKRAAIIWIHGGSFYAGDKSQYGKNGNLGAAPEYAKRGYVSIPINYRLQNHPVVPASPDIGAATQQAKYDAMAAVRWVRAHANEYRIDPNRIIVGGSSAGAWTSLYVAYDTGNVGTSGNPGIASNVAAAVSFAGGMSPGDRELITRGEPPAIFLHGANDTVVPIGLPTAVFNQLQSLNIPSEFHTYPGGHGAANTADAHEKVRRFLMTTLKLDQASFIGDLDGNGVVNIVDFTLLMNHWFTNNIAKIDFNHDGKVSVIDYTIFMNSWYEYLKGK